MAKRPASQYYWGDWRRDTALQACSIAARGLWHEMNCLMHDCEPYGHLMVGPTAMKPAQLARLVGITPKESAELVAELEAAGVFSRTDSGAIYSRRMVRDEDLRERRASGGQVGAGHGVKGALHGGKGGRPSQKNPPQNPPPDDGEGGLKTPLDGGKKPPPAFASASASAKPLTTEDYHDLAGGRTLAASDVVGGSPPTEAGLVCKALRRAGIADTNPGHPRLLALMQAGATEAEFAGFAPAAIAKGAGFAWILGAVEGERSRAASTAGALHKGPMPTKSDVRVAANIAVAQRFLERTAK